MSVTTMEKVHALLTEWGFTVDTRKGWETRKASSIAFAPEFIVEHHTGGNTTPDSLLANGRTGLKGPLCHWTIDRDGTIRAIAAGYANHAGYSNQTAVNTLIKKPPLDRDIKPGSDTAGYSANRRAWGIEVKTGGAFTAAQNKSTAALEAAICLVQGWTQPRVGAHREITRRKIDPVHPMYKRRQEVLELMTKKPIIIVAGSANTAEGKLHEKYRRRLDVVRTLLDKDPNLKVIVTGGAKKDKGGTTESGQARAYLLSKGVANSRIVEESTSGSTYGNFMNGLPIAKAKGATSIIVVSDFSHMRRCLAFAYAANKTRKTGIPISGAEWYKDSSTQDATVSQATAQAKMAWSGMTETIVRNLDNKWGVTSSPVLPATIRKGSEGATVKQWQTLLRQFGFKEDILNRKLVRVDGVFGSGTARATKRFQKKYNLVTDGIAGPATWTKALGV